MARRALFVAFTTFAAATAACSLMLGDDLSGTDRESSSGASASGGASGSPGTKALSILGRLSSAPRQVSTIPGTKQARQRGS